MKRTLCTVLLAWAGVLWAAPSSQVTWSPQTLRFVAGGDAAKGEKLAQTCASCHGQDGISVNPAWPDLAGQGAFYLYKQLQDYKQGTRHNPIMSPISAGLDDQAMRDLAAFYAQRPLPQAKAAQRPLPEAETLARRGDNRRMIPACNSCHDDNGRGNLRDIPALAAQQPEYFRLTMQAFKSADRANDIYSRMRLIAKQLSDEEIAGLGEYYGSVGAK